MAEGSLQTRQSRKQGPQACAEILVRGERIQLTSHRAAIWANTRTAILSDVHLGKVDGIAVHGVALPSSAIDSQLAALDSLIDAHRPLRLIIVGDLLHAAIGLTPQLRQSVAAWRARCPLPILVIPGNHDRAMSKVAAEWNLTICPAHYTEGPFKFIHDPDELRPSRPAQFTFSGHIHPAVHLAAGGDSLRLPCFHLKPELCILPAFSSFTSGVGVRPDAGDRLFAIAEGHVVEI